MNCNEQIPNKNQRPGIDEIAGRVGEAQPDKRFAMGVFSPQKTDRTPWSKSRIMNLEYVYMKKIWIIGMGQFGRLAFRSLSKRPGESRFVLVDPVEENLQRADGPHCILEKADGVAYLTQHLHPGNTADAPDWIIPAAPVHLAAEWCMSLLAAEGLQRIEPPPGIEPLLSNPMRGAEGDLYVSHADFFCPGDCPEPRDLCTVTQEPRKPNMFELLGEIRLPPFQPLVIRSRQLGPGIGGCRPEQFFTLLTRVRQAAGPVLASTACRCHGVITAMGKRKS